MYLKKHTEGEGRPNNTKVVYKVSKYLLFYIYLKLFTIYIGCMYTYTHMYTYIYVLKELKLLRLTCSPPKNIN